MDKKQAVEVAAQIRSLIHECALDYAHDDNACVVAAERKLAALLSNSPEPVTPAVAPPTVDTDTDFLSPERAHTIVHLGKMAHAYGDSTNASTALLHARDQILAGNHRPPSTNTNTGMPCPSCGEKQQRIDAQWHGDELHVRVSFSVDREFAHDEVKGLCTILNMLAPAPTRKPEPPCGCDEWNWCSKHDPRNRKNCDRPSCAGMGARCPCRQNNYSPKRGK